MQIVFNCSKFLNISLAPITEPTCGAGRDHREHLDNNYFNMEKDIRDKPHLDHDEIVALNFIRSPGHYLFREHYYTGLRSHIMGVLDRVDVEKERKGIVFDNLRWYPRAEPLKMLRIFRIRFNELEDAEEEIRKLKMIQEYLAPHHLARSEEFIVHYLHQEKREILLCGLQEYVKGEMLDPWSPLDKSHLISLMGRMTSGKKADEWVHGVREKAENFIMKLRRLILEENVVPDLAGMGNLILTPSGHIKLVDINNISKVSFHPTIRVDDRGYPVCDKSMEALSLLEHKLLNRVISKSDFIYKKFLDTERMKEVKKLVKNFHLTMRSASSHRWYYSE
jgi:hypothetical protein